MGGNLCAGLLPLASLAQLVEQRTFNSWVVGSNPTGGTVGDAEVVEVQVCVVPVLAGSSPVFHPNLP